MTAISEAYNRAQWIWIQGTKGVSAADAGSEWDMDKFYVQAAKNTAAKPAPAPAPASDPWAGMKGHTDAELASYFGASAPPAKGAYYGFDTPEEAKAYQNSGSIQAIMDSEHVDQATAIKIASGQIPRPSDGARATAPGTGVPPIEAKPGIDWKKLDEQIRAAQQDEAIRREQLAQQKLIEANRLAFEKGTATGKVDGINTMESTKYGNDILSNPQNAALSEQIRKGYALGDKPGQTVADYLNRTVDNPVSTIPKVPGAITGAEIQLINDAYAKDKGAAERWFSADEGARQNVAKGLLNPLPGPPAPGAPFKAIDISGVENSQSREAVKQNTALKVAPKKDEEHPFYGGGYYWNSAERAMQANDLYSQHMGDINYDLMKEMAADDGSGPGLTGAPDTSGVQDYLGGVAERTGNVAHAIMTPFNAAKSLQNRISPFKDGGTKTIGGEPHWIVDNEGTPVAALTEDGKKEQVKGKGGVEVVPLDPQRKAAYEARKKNVPGLLNGGKLGQRAGGQRGAPSRRPGSTIGNSNKTQSGSRATLPDGSIADRLAGVADGRSGNGKTNNGSRQPLGSDRGQTGTDRDAQSVRPAASGGIKDLAAQVQEKIQANGPTPVKITPGASYMPGNPPAGQAPLGNPVTKRPVMGVSKWPTTGPSPTPTDGYATTGGGTSGGVGQPGMPTINPQQLGGAKGTWDAQLPERGYITPQDQLRPGLPSIDRADVVLSHRPFDSGQAAATLGALGKEYAPPPGATSWAAAFPAPAGGPPPRPLHTELPAPVRTWDINKYKDTVHALGDGSNIQTIPGREEGGDVALALRQLSSLGLDSPAKVWNNARAGNPTAAVAPQVGHTGLLGSIDKYAQTPLANHAMRLASYIEGGSGPNASSWGNGDGGLAYGPYQVRADAHPDYDSSRANDGDYNTEYMSNSYNQAAERVMQENPGLWESDPAKASALTAFYAERPANMYDENNYRTHYENVRGLATGGSLITNNLGSPPPKGAPGVAPAQPTFIASGGPRVIDNSVSSARFGFNASAPTNIAGQNQLMGVKNNPGVFVQAAWKWNPRTLRNMTTADRAMLESQVRATGNDPASFYDQAKYSEPGDATTGRAFY